ncbi:hypothetical protein [Jeongeupia chitinilytica]|uniref:DUF3135 domain-containing protein n=1 Tax=Jeongeupia chitinilytica TaxID=1041641 RepID=A0ABQ3GZS2_9NEIS|nr:hypothetical protein [Jeongeupia chitinilytica]GHD61591.1 hypothetical protein GCM10007350_16170 [Jeongeupia chitinilytica]
MLNRLKTLLSTQWSERATRQRDSAMAMATTIPQYVARKVSSAAYHDLLFRIEMAQLNGQALAIREPATRQPPLLRSIVADLDKLAIQHPERARMLRMRLFGTHDPNEASARSRFVSAALRAGTRTRSSD